MCETVLVFALYTPPWSELIHVVWFDEMTAVPSPISGRGILQIRFASCMASQALRRNVSLSWVISSLSRQGLEPYGPVGLSLNRTFLAFLRFSNGTGEMGVLAPSSNMSGELPWLPPVLFTGAVWRVIALMCVAGAPSRLEACVGAALLGGAPSSRLLVCTGPKI